MISCIDRIKFFTTISSPKSSACFAYAFIYGLSKKPLIFKSFNGLTVIELDNIWNKETTKRQNKNELWHKQKENRFRLPSFAKLKNT